MCIEYRNKSLRSPTQSLTPLNASTPSAIDTAALRLLVAIGTMEPAQPAAFTL
ncbi:hypothetical protein AGABI2DRAFT_134301 [Agaricus bisporus var. bisporus H97]|uniref:hypothetical protein n=1 Tax=Agaricus bisporus var. bisporus (strain H97 / ATCC MYA-4626 / FGSC 10389) TaxID=936046 RepID=UPI00029F607E|nr:hypothetical protein AGABI2DRAFT_134301 [Agaricus bisporus var. bisporus H97]EKV50540.1 hypothetical protein AGABI2DRAFT_134301 [Agaricus bisporus var. bisporus H97]